MASLCLGDFSARDDCIVAGHKLHAIMIWPREDEADSRTEYLAVVAQRTLQDWPNRACRNLLDECGGEATILNARPLDVLEGYRARAYRGWVVTHAVVRNLLNLPILTAGTSARPSIRKAAEMALSERDRWYLLDDPESKPTTIRRDAKWVKAQFNAHRSVAHLCSAYVNLHQLYRLSWPQSSELLFDHQVYGGMQQILGHALTIERCFAEDLEATTIDPSCLTSVSEIPGVEPLDIPLVVPTDVEIGALEDYRAPIGPA